MFYNLCILCINLCVIIFLTFLNQSVYVQSITASKVFHYMELMDEVEAEFPLPSSLIA